MDIIKRNLKKIPLPPNNILGNNNNTIALSIYGDMIFIDNDNNIKLYKVRSPNDNDLYKDLPFNNNENDDILNKIRNKKYNNIMFNTDCTLLLLYSKDNIDFIEFTRKSDGEVAGCNYSELNLNNNDDKINNIIKVSFHPWSFNHIIILQEKVSQRQSLVLIDIFTSKINLIDLDTGSAIDNNFVSFTFGPCLDFLSVTVLLLTVKGNIYALCPLLPRGSFIPSGVVEEMKSWIEQTHDKKSEYAMKCDKYMKEAFPPSKSKYNHMYEVGDNLDLSMNIIDDSILSSLPKLQGPFLFTNIRRNDSKER